MKSIHRTQETTLSGGIARNSQPAGEGGGNAAAASFIDGGLLGLSFMRVLRILRVLPRF
jgi:hypothetical protein